MITLAPETLLAFETLEGCAGAVGKEITGDGFGGGAVAFLGVVFLVGFFVVFTSGATLTGFIDGTDLENLDDFAILRTIFKLLWIYMNKLSFSFTQRNFC